MCFLSCGATLAEETELAYVLSGWGRKVWVCVFFSLHRSDVAAVVVVTVIAHLYRCLLYSTRHSTQLVSTNSFNDLSKLQDWLYPFSILLGFLFACLFVCFLQIHINV